MSAGYRLAPAAQRDLADIWTYTARVWGALQAKHYILSIRDACEALALGRKRGQPIDDIRPGYRKFTVGSHVLFYRVGDAGTIDIIRILHQRMDVARRLLGD
jgi:toxin ParE1/3/4